MQLLVNARAVCGIPPQNKYFFASDSADGHLDSWLVLHNSVESATAAVDDESATAAADVESATAAVDVESATAAVDVECPLLFAMLTVLWLFLQV